MARIIEYGHSESDEILTLDLHDKNEPLVDRVAFVLLMYGKCKPKDFRCTKQELAEAMKEL